MPGIKKQSDYESLESNAQVICVEEMAGFIQATPVAVLPLRRGGASAPGAALVEQEDKVVCLSKREAVLSPLLPSYGSKVETGTVWGCGGAVQGLGSWWK